jgi:hypothetical protein
MQATVAGDGPNLILDTIFLLWHLCSCYVLYSRLGNHLDWDLAIKRNSEALQGIIAGLFAMLELAGGITVSRIPQSLHSALRRVLYPAESAVRRLIIIAARGLVVKLASPRPGLRPKPVGKIAKGGGSKSSSFQLFDTRKDFPELRQPRIKYAKHPPRILFFHEHSRVDDLWARPAPAAAKTPPSDGLVNAVPLTRRLETLKSALEDLPGQARRFARWRARREAMPSPKFRSPLRPGQPPGHRRKPIHLVDEVLIDCHGLAWDALKPDTS